MQLLHEARQCYPQASLSRGLGDPKPGGVDVLGAAHPKSRESNVATVKLVKTFSCLDGFDRPFVRMKLEGLQHSLRGVPLPFEVKQFLRFVGDLVGRRLPEL